MLLVNTTGNFGDSIFISGSGDSFYKISEVRFGGTSGVASEFQVVDENLIQAVVPSFEKLETTGEKYTWANFCPPSYPIVISDARGVSGLASGENNEVFTPVPLVKDFNPKSTFSGETIYLYGDGFLGATGVRLTGISGDNTAYHTGVGFTGYTGYEEKICEFSGINNTGIEVTLPSGNTKGLFTVYGTGVSGSSSTFFEPDVQIKAFFTGTNFADATGENLSGLYFYKCNDLIISGLDFSEELLHYTSGSTEGIAETGYLVDFGLSNSKVRKDEFDLGFAITGVTGSGGFNITGNHALEQKTVSTRLADPENPESQYTRVRVTGFFEKISNTLLSGKVPSDVNLPETSLVKNSHLSTAEEASQLYSSLKLKTVSDSLGVSALGGQGNKIAIREDIYRSYNTGLLRITGSGVIETGYFDNPLSGTGQYSKNLLAFGVSTGDNPEAIVAFGENSIVSYSTKEPLIYFSTGARYGAQPLSLEGTDFYAEKYGKTGDVKTTNPFLVFVPEFNNLTFEDCFDYYATSGFFPSGCEPQVLFYISGGLANGTTDISGNLVSAFYNPQRYLDITSNVFTPKLLKCFLTSQLIDFPSSPDLTEYTGHTEIQEFCNTYYHTDITNMVNNPYSTTAGGASSYILAETSLLEKRVGGGASSISFNPPPFEFHDIIDPTIIVNSAHAAIAPFSDSGIYFGRPDGSAYPADQGPTGEHTNKSFYETDTFDDVTTVHRDGRTQKWGISYVNDGYRFFPQPCWRPEADGLVGINTDPTGDFFAYNIININCKPEYPINQRPPFWHNTNPSEYLQKDTKIDKPFNSTSWSNVAVLQSAPAPMFGMPATSKTIKGYTRMSLFPTGRTIESAAEDSYEANFEFAKPKGNPSQPLFTTPNPSASFLPSQTVRIGQEITLNTPIGTVIGAISAPQNEPEVKLLVPAGTGIGVYTEVEIEGESLVMPADGEDNTASNAPILPSEVTTAYPMNTGPFRSAVNITDKVKVLNQTTFKLNI